MVSRKLPSSKGTALRQAFQRLMFGEEGTSGAALVEATIFVPILVVMMVYTADFGLIFYNEMEVQNAAQAGAQWAIANRVYNCSSIQTAAQNATAVSATVSSSQFCGCSEDSSGNLVVSPLTSPAVCTSAVCASAPSTCSAPCTSAPNTTCNTSGVEGNYVTVSATPTTTYQSFAPYGLISSSYNISTTTTARIQ
jgi:Flp pilus assembly protein TadG